MSTQLDDNQIEMLKTEFIQMDETALVAAYKEFKKNNVSSGSASKEVREMGMAYLRALGERKAERERLEEFQRQQQQAYTAQQYWFSSGDHI